MCCGRKSSKPRRSGKAKAKIRKMGITAREVLGQTGAKMEFLLCRPQFYGINYSINPWMDITNDANQSKVVEQWNSLESKIKELGAQVRKVKPQKGLPDMVFTANAGLLLKTKQVILSHFTHPERNGEEKWFEEWFLANGYEVIKTDKFFEGAGDALYLGDKLIGGYGFRSDPDFYNSLTDLTVKLVNPYFYHLDTCFCPLDNNDYMIFDGAFDSESLAKIRALGNEILVPEAEAKLFACNAVKIEKHVLLPAGCPVTMELLRAKGYTPHALEMSEFIKSGGACKCLTLAL